MSIVICPICMDMIDKSESDQLNNVEVNKAVENQSSNSINVTECGHIFHSKCIQLWLSTSKEKPNCPTCRKPLDVNKISQLYPQFLDICEKPLSSQGIDTAIEKHFTNLFKVHLEKINETKRNLQRKGYQNNFDVQEIILNPFDRITRILRNKKLSGKNLTSLEEEIIELLSTMQYYNNKLKEEMQKAGSVKNISQNSRTQKDFVNSLQNINKLVSKEQALKISLERKILKLNVGDVISLMNEECNKIAIEMRKQKKSNYEFINQQFEAIEESIRDIESQLAKHNFKSKRDEN